MGKKYGIFTIEIQLGVEGTFPFKSMEQDGQNGGQIHVKSMVRTLNRRI